ncbi:MAG: cell division protein ZapD [Gammaproteobacteria bacterium]|nr:cell division protein ZapD [Gammaproteobacteria bacterium]
MSATAKSAAMPLTSRSHAEYEQPVNERMRTFMRLEFLYRQMLYNCESESDWATRAATGNLLDIMAILMRGDVRSDVHKELDHQIDKLQRFKSQPQVDGARLDNLIANLVATRDDVDAVGTQFLQPLKESEFLSAIKHRSAIPGGTCEFDLPEYSHWLRQDYSRRQKDVNHWLAIIRPVCDAVIELLWLIRESAQPQPKTAINGMFQHSMKKDSSCRLLRVTLPEHSTLYPEISGSQHRFIIRFLEWSTIEHRAVQTGHDVDFQISIC